MTALAVTWIAVTSLAQTGRLDVQLVLPDGSLNEVPGVVVYVTDEAGEPIPTQPKNELKERPNPFLHSFYMISMDQFVNATTDAKGQVAFDELPAGRYRVIAQKWDGVDGHPQHPKGFKSANRWRMIPNGVTAFGVATGEVKAGKTTSLSVKPLGDAELAITVKLSHRGDLLSVSLGKPLVMPELASSIMNRHLDRETILVQHVSQTNGDVILRGLPSDQEVTVALMAYDNNPGLGGIVSKTGPGVRREIKVHAGWSDAEPIPEPDSLKPLMEFLEANEDSLDVFQILDVGARDDYLLVTGRDHINEMKLYDEASKVAAKSIDIEGYGETTVAEFMTARAFVQKRKRDAIQKLKEEQHEKKIQKSTDEDRSDVIPER